MILSNLKKNHRYVFYKQRQNSNDITKFRAVLISICNDNLLVHSYESDDKLCYNYSNQCIWSFPINWIVKVEVADEDMTIDHKDIIINCK